jgi:hypothetical protein
MDPFTLRFHEPLEREFADEYFERTLKEVRTAILLGAFLYTVFGLVDAVVAPDHLRELLIIRFAIVVPLIGGCFAFSYTAAFRRHRDWAVSGIILIAGLGLVAMIRIISPPANDLYYAGLLLAMMFITLTRLSLPHAVILSALLTTLYLGVSLWLGRAEPAFILFNAVILASTMVIVFLANYYIERYARTNFLQRRVIQQRTQELEDKNVELMVKNQMLAESRAENLRTARRSELIFSALSEALPGTVLDDKYRLDEKIGSGNFGTVYRGEHMLLHHPVAIKVFRPAVGNTALESLDRFRLEGISACRINHPNAVTVLDFDVSAGSLAYLVMELLEGCSLADELHRLGKFSAARTAQVATSVCDVLAEAHGAGIVHRDIKPSNVFLHRGKTEEQVKVIDFGIAKLTGEGVESDMSATITGTWVGSPAYMAPERFTGDPYDGRADVFAVGVMMYEMLTAQLPYQSTPGGQWSFASMHAKAPATPSTIEPAVPPALDAAIMRAMSRQPENRPSAADLATELRTTLSD